jgi:hypothetical protein
MASSHELVFRIVTEQPFAQIRQNRYFVQFAERLFMAIGYGNSAHTFNGTDLKMATSGVGARTTMGRSANVARVDTVSHRRTS